MAANLYKSCDQILFFRNAKDRNGDPIADTAVCTYTITSKHLVDDEYQELAAGTMEWVSEGRWEVVLDADVMADVIIGMYYNIVIELSDPDDNEVRKVLVAVGANYT